MLKRLELHPSEELLAAVHEWRRRQPEPPAVAVACRRLILSGLKYEAMLETMATQQAASTNHTLDAHNTPKSHDAPDMLDSPTPALDAPYANDTSDAYDVYDTSDAVQAPDAAVPSEPQPVTSWLDPKPAKPVAKPAKAPKPVLHRTPSSEVEAKTPDVLRLAADGRKLSHQAIADEVGLTRSTVFNIIQRAKVTA